MHSHEELTVRAQKALTFGVIQLIQETSSTNAAENAVKAAEYPSSVCKAARALALLREHYYQSHYIELIKPLVYSLDEFNRSNHEENVRIFNCGWSIFGFGSNRCYEQEGVVHVYPQADMPPLFWEYQVYDENDSMLASTIRTDRPTEMKNIQGIFSEGSQSIPLGLQFRLWPNITRANIQFGSVNQFQKIMWERYTKAESGTQQLTREASRIDRSHLVPREKITLELKASRGSQAKTCRLVFLRRIGATGWPGQAFSSEIRMGYTFLHTAEIAEQSRHTILAGSAGETTGNIVIVPHIDNPVLEEQVYHSVPLARAISEMLFSQKKISVRKTLANCFSFKFQEIDMLKCLA